MSTTVDSQRVNAAQVIYNFPIPTNKEEAFVYMFEKATSTACDAHKATYLDIIEYINAQHAVIHGIQSLVHTFEQTATANHVVDHGGVVEDSASENDESVTVDGSEIEYV